MAFITKIVTIEFLLKYISKLISGKSGPSTTQRTAWKPPFQFMDMVKRVHPVRLAIFFQAKFDNKRIQEYHSPQVRIPVTYLDKFTGMICIQIIHQNLQNIQTS